MLALAAVYWLYLEDFSFDNTELTLQEQACINSGGELTSTSCCLSSDDFPNSCLIGVCGCSPISSHEVKFCDCGENMCFNGISCVAR
jgi:hypothetical protein